LFCCYPHLNEVDRLSYLQYLLNLERWKNWYMNIKSYWQKIDST
jgi:hypothetical protein